MAGIISGTLNANMHICLRDHGYDVNNFTGTQTIASRHPSNDHTDSCQPHFTNPVHIQYNAIITASGGTAPYSQRNVRRTANQSDPECY